MKQKILLWLTGYDWTEFSIAYYMQKTQNYEFYAIIDTQDNPKEFFETQSLVTFKKIWFYHDFVNVSTIKKNDLINSFEKKYNIPAMSIAKNDRIFMEKYNVFHKFSNEEILQIVGNECQLFETVLDEVKPDFFLSLETAFRPHHFFYLACRSKHVKILMLNTANWGDYCYISENYHKLENFQEKFFETKTEKTSYDEQQKRLSSMKLSNKTKTFFKNQQKSEVSKFSAAFYYLFKSKNKTQKTHYTHYGRTKLKVLLNEISINFKRKSRKKFIDENLSYQIPNNQNLIFFALQQEPERSLLISAPDYIDQVENINFIAKSMPKNYHLVVKEHPTQGPPTRDWRPKSDYKKMMNTPNVTMIHPSVPADKIMKKSKLIISVSGTVALESTFFGIPSITFADNDYPLIPSVSKLNTKNELPKLIEKSLGNTSNNADNVKKYFDILEKNSFIFNLYEFQLAYYQQLYFDANLFDVKISENNLKKFLLNQKENLENLANEFNKKISQD